MATTTTRFDTFGAALSGLCALHCLLTPTLVALMPAAVGLGDERVESLLLMSAVALAIAAALIGWRRHGRSTPLALFAVAGAVLAAGRIVGEGHAAGHALVIGGALGLVVAHIHNHRCASCATCESQRAVRVPPRAT